ncbi:hypothetical protein L3049_07315 [Labilibaculum sp. DW002]|uniref:Uncharacterized protein n=1 Tax=Paralabilibaculum antarcticum TaxID=2912572 RepID=A0ABT5VQW1_9BACT|nr:hypothetical protein [Labilibaculum sp. DW002]MDE5417814.1 hypothetical protein [Labilibaculum sp. DW002]
MSKKEIQYSLLGVLLLVFVVWLGLRMNKWNKYLNSSERLITVATFYDSHRSGGSKSDSRTFKYFYKINRKIYFESVVVDYIKKDEVGKGKIVQFCIVISKIDPTIHCVIWNKKINNFQKIRHICNYKIDERTIQYYTMMIGLTPRGRLDPEEEVELRKINLLH